MFHDIISSCIIMHNMIIEYEYDTHGSIVDLNVMSIQEVDMIVDKTEQFQWFLLPISELQIRKLIMHFEMN